MAKEIIVLVGIPGSGKSTYAKKVVKESKGTAVRINKDDIREQCFPGRKFSKEREKRVIDIRDGIIQSMLHPDHIRKIIVDDTNLHPKHVDRIREIAGDSATVTEKFFDISLNADQCHKNNTNRNTPVPYEVIENMYAQYFKLWLKRNGMKQWPLNGDESMPSAVIFDIDGTIAHRVNRSPFDWNRVGEDNPDSVICNILQMHHDQGYRVILMSGRDEVCREQTMDWLDRYEIPYHDLHMRSQGDTDKDYAVKFDLYMNHVFNRYNVAAVFDDRMQTTRTWRAMGLKCLQVAPGHF